MDETQDGSAGTEVPEQEPDYKALYEQVVQEKDGLSRRLEDSKKHSRKWKSAAKKQSRTIDERVAALEQENADLKARAARDGLVKSVAKETGCPFWSSVDLAGNQTLARLFNTNADFLLNSPYSNIDGPSALNDDEVELVSGYRRLGPGRQGITLRFVQDQVLAIEYERETGNEDEDE